MHKHVGHIRFCSVGSRRDSNARYLLKHALAPRSCISLPGYVHVPGPVADNNTYSNRCIERLSQ